MADIGKKADSGKKQAPTKKGKDAAKTPPSPPPLDEEEEDGDIATPKRDRYGPDDEPL